MLNLIKLIYRNQTFGHLVTNLLAVRRVFHCRWLFVVLAAMTFMLISVDVLQAQLVQPPMINRENQIKAAYLYNFARYIQWPGDTFANPKAPFVIGVVGKDPILKDLQNVAKTRTIDDHPIVIKQFDIAKEVTPCQILFFSPTLDPYVQEKVLQKMAGRNVLLVGQTSNFLDGGGVIGFVVSQNRIRLVIDLEAVQRQKLKISAKLLRVAKVVD